MDNLIIIIMLLLGLCGGFWRRIDGTNIYPKWQRQILLLTLLVSGVAQTSFPVPAQVWLIAVLWLGLERGFHDWNRPRLMVLHFTAVFVVLSIFNLWVLPVAAIAGLAWPICLYFHEQLDALPRNKIFNGYTTYAEFISNFILFGGIPLL